MKKIIIIFLLLFFISSSIISSQTPYISYVSETIDAGYITANYKQSIKIASFNVLHLGWNNEKDYTALADIISNFDICGLIEVMNEEGLLLLQEELINNTGIIWDVWVSEDKVGRSTYREYYAYIWRSDKIDFVNSEGFYQEINDEFIREPYGATFISGDFDFTLVLSHIIWGDRKSDREAEIKYLDDVYNYFQDMNEKENDIIIAGDFNMPSDEECYGELFTHSDNISYLIDDEMLTTIGKTGLSSSYDNIFFSDDYTSREYDNKFYVYDFTEYFNYDYEYIRKHISDHLPVIGEFIISAQGDD